MMETIIKDKIIKGDLICDGKLIFAAGLGRVDIEGRIRAKSIKIKEGTNISSRGYIHSDRYIHSGGDISSRRGIYSDGDISSHGDISSRGDISSGGDIYSRGYIHSDRYIHSCGDISSRRGISSGGSISSGGYIYSDRYISSRGYIHSGGDIYSHGYISSGGDIYFSYHLIFKTKITCKLLRLSSDSEIERQYWIEKFNLFGFKKIAKQISTGCVQEIQPIFADKKTAARLLKCKYFTKLEKLIIKSWHKGELKDESL